ncbi:predicted protein [Verticillium alfalfae VaMs.102]|uniref:Predicted protein n=1 Tax=Verticillium alfalfae (strain VaMs.102 / ATCC MYA-4576 / FGSC 10136) TaxID=526221 RepID=C9SCY7_VERA1|nr:predicted protein [Verticillium alfalfae VaMs.102]EEY16952.1 predicted protein [Verticillium alfalfae VaMs.102]
MSDAHEEPLYPSLAFPNSKHATLPKSWWNFENFANVVDGQLKSTEGTRTGINPATLEPLAPVPVSSPADVDAAVEAAAGVPLCGPRRRSRSAARASTSMPTSWPSSQNEFAALPHPRSRAKPCGGSKKF